MPKFAANLSMLFTEIPFLDRFDAAAKAGFKGVEYLFPYDFNAENIKEKLDANGLTQVLFNMPPGDWDAGERGIACLPDRQAEFRAGVDQAIAYARALGCRQVNCLSGLKPDNMTDAICWETLVDNLRYAANKLEAEGIKLMVEAINSRVDMPGFFLDTADKVIDAIKETGSSNMFLQYDIYHMQIMEGDLARRMETLLPQIGHIQFADNPGRHEPGTGEINYLFLFNHLDKLGYQGWVSAEYRPATNTSAGLTWFRECSL